MKKIQALQSQMLGREAWRLSEGKFRTPDVPQLILQSEMLDVKMKEIINRVESHRKREDWKLELCT